MKRIWPYLPLIIMLFSTLNLKASKDTTWCFGLQLSYSNLWSFDNGKDFYQQLTFQKMARQKDRFELSNTTLGIAAGKLIGNSKLLTFSTGIASARLTESLKLGVGTCINFCWKIAPRLSNDGIFNIGISHFYPITKASSAGTLSLKDYFEANLGLGTLPLSAKGLINGYDIRLNLGITKLNDQLFMGINLLATYLI